MWRAALLSTPSPMCAGPWLMSSEALCTLKMVVFSTPDATVPALHLFLPRLTLEPRVAELMRYGSPVHTPLTTCRVRNERSSWRDTRVSATGWERRTLCAITCGSAVDETPREVEGAGMLSKRPLALSFLMYAMMWRSCSSLKNRSSCALRWRRTSRNGWNGDTWRRREICEGARYA